VPLNTIYQVRARQQYGTGGKEMETVWFFDHTAGSGDATHLATVWGTSRGALINPLQTELIKNLSIDVINLGDLSDFASVPWLGTGAVTDDTMPPYAAYGYTMKVNTRAVRKGSKRISGVPETAITAGVVTAAPVLANAETLRLAMQIEMTDATDTYLPVVVKRVKEPVVGTIPPQFTYRLPTTDAELVLGEVVVVLFNKNLSHQVSREL
jgi:hypothetical protein